ncbi:restriction endonuclease subunit S [Modicisalibacter sp. 'Wilcox']|uniref:restriction endonuclease subunit S n=1 Tax=Modicisalibacter sp. 'Wilcox' TaxID=2679914 RepID=UPI0013D6498E|nr:restriction endonuclease subunit S [Modicisalibacter sp. 'Wilcox']
MVPVSEVFDVIYGTNLELNRLIQTDDGINFVSRSSRNNGVSAKVKKLPDIEPIEGGVLTVAGGGSVLETFLQPEPFYSGRDLFYLKPKIDLTESEKLFYCVCIRHNKYRYSYGRQANRTLKDIMIPSLDEFPEWVYNVNVIDNMLRVLKRIKV